MRVSVHQPDFIPWEGFWARTLHSERLILITGVPHSKGDVTSRVKIDGHWLSLPLKNRSYGDTLNDLTVDRFDVMKALKTLEGALMGKSNQYRDRLLSMLEVFRREGRSGRGETMKLMSLNIALIHEIAKVLQVEAEITIDTEPMEGETKTERLYSVMARSPSLCGQVVDYVTGAGGANYLEPHPGFRPLYVTGAFQDASVLQLIARHPDPRTALVERIEKFSTTL